MRKSLQDWVEAALVVADSNGMSGDEVIPTWPELIVEKYPDFYPELTIGALRDWQVGRAQIAEARAIVDQVVAELEAGFVRCERCGDQEDTATLDCMPDLRRLKTLLSAHASRPADGWLSEVAAERQRQDLKWGGPEHDDKKSPNDFVQHIADYAGWARVMAGMGSFEKYRRRMIQVAALAGAAVEAVDRARGRSASNPSGQDGQLTECDWCHQEYPDEMLQNETQAGDAICKSCVEKLDRQEEQRNSFGGPA